MQQQHRLLLRDEAPSAEGAGRGRTCWRKAHQRAARRALRCACQRSSFLVPNPLEDEFVQHHSHRYARQRVSCARNLGSTADGLRRSHL